MICWAAGAPAGEGAAADGPLRLDQAIAMALSRNPQAMEAKWRVDELEARAEAARAERRAVFSARAGYDRYTEDQRLFQPSSAGQAGVFGPDILAAEVAVGLPLYTGGRVKSTVKAAELHRDAADARLARTREEVIFEVTRLFYEGLAQRRTIDAVESAVRAMEEYRRTTAEQVAAEKAAPVDLLRMDVRLAGLRERRTREHNALAVQRRALASLLGWEDPVPPDVTGDLPDPETLPTPDPAHCVAEAFANRPDWAAARGTVAAQEQAFAAAQARSRPTVSLQAAYTERYMPDPSEPAMDPDDEYGVGRVGVSIEWPWLDGGLAAARTREEAARLGAAREQLRRLSLQIRYEIETAVTEMASARERVRALEHSAEQARETLRIIREKQELGKATLTDLLEAQAALVETEALAVRALADLALAEARRRLATGGEKQ